MVLTRGAMSLKALLNELSRGLFRGGTGTEFIKVWGIWAHTKLSDIHCYILANKVTLEQQTLYNIKNKIKDIPKSNTIFSNYRSSFYIILLLHV